MWWFLLHCEMPFLGVNLKKIGISPLSIYPLKYPKCEYPVIRK